MSRNVTRRDLLRGACVAGMGAMLSPGRAWPLGQSPNEKLNIAFVGAGGRGAANLAELADQNVVALCDVDQRRAGPSFAKYPGAKVYRDFRKMLDEMDRQIDAVAVSAPNHIHAPASAAAMRRGKHCYCEKPLSHSLHEARVMAHLAAEKKVATQMGTQIHASDNFRRIVELVRAGAVGTVREVHIWLRGGGGGKGDRPAETPPVPEGLDWDLWIGPAPYRPYHPCYLPREWHFWWDFGGGAFGNMGCHYLDLPFWALGLRHPATVEAAGPPVHAESTPEWQQVRYEFAARGQWPAVTLTWNHGTKTPPFWEGRPLPGWAWGVFVGEAGTLAVDYGKHQLLPKEKYADFKPPEPSIPASIGHHKEWVEACKTGAPTSCNFDYSGAVTETMHLGNIAYRVGKPIEWDPVPMKVTNVPEANQYVRREYRKGWEL